MMPNTPVSKLAADVAERYMAPRMIPVAWGIYHDLWHSEAICIYLACIMSWIYHKEMLEWLVV